MNGSDEEKHLRTHFPLDKFMSLFLLSPSSFFYSTTLGLLIVVSFLVWKQRVPCCDDGGRRNDALETQ